MALKFELHKLFNLECHVMPCSLMGKSSWLRTTAFPMDYSQAPATASMPLGTIPPATHSYDRLSDSATIQAGPSGSATAGPAARSGTATAGPAAGDNSTHGGDASNWAELPPMLSLECPICLESPRDTVLVPCGHLLCK